MISDSLIETMSRANSKEDFGRAFLEMQKMCMPTAMVSHSSFDEYVKRTGEALYNRILNQQRTRRRPSDAKRAFHNESKLFRDKIDWRGSNPSLANYYACLFADLSTDLRNGTAGNRDGAARTIERYYVDQAVDSWNDFVSSIGRPEWRDTILKPGFKPNDMSSRPGQASYERSFLERLVLAAAKENNRTLLPRGVKSAIRSRAKKVREHTKNTC